MDPSINLKKLKTNLSSGKRTAFKIYIDQIPLKKYKTNFRTTMMALSKQLLKDTSSSNN